MTPGQKLIATNPITNHGMTVTKKGHEYPIIEVTSRGILVEVDRGHPYPLLNNEVDFFFENPSVSFIGHPATCDCSGGSKCERKNGTGEGEMKTIDKKFICPCGEYIQFTIGENGNPVYPPKFGIWQPIESAPKDGTIFIGLEDDEVYKMKWVPEKGFRLPDGESHKIHIWGGEFEYEYPNPTHWTPLPELPEKI